MNSFVKKNVPKTSYAIKKNCILKINSLKHVKFGYFSYAVVAESNERFVAVRTFGKLCFIKPTRDAIFVSLLTVLTSSVAFASPWGASSGLFSRVGSPGTHGLILLRNLRAALSRHTSTLVSDLSTFKLALPNRSHHLEYDSFNIYSFAMKLLKMIYRQSEKPF